MIAFKPPLIVQRAEDDETQSSAEFLACCRLQGKSRRALRDEIGKFLSHTRPDA